MKYRYPIGTRIRYRGVHREDVGKVGEIVGYVDEKIVWIIVPESHLASDLFGDSKHRWFTFITDIEVLAIKNQQLLFEFMSEAT